jgi:hypothetical protein
LGKGGSGTTYAATDQQTGQTVAIKILSLRATEDWKTLDLFEREARVLATLDHPGIPHYLDSFQVDLPGDQWFCLVQAFVEGTSLAECVDQGGRLSEAKVKEIAQQTLEILVYLHRLYPPVIHRDIKPQNLLITPEGQICLIDFGAVQEVYRQTVVGSSTVVGTLGYMAPEQLRGQNTCASDLYALGASLAFLLTGRSPDRLPTERMKLNPEALVDLSPAFSAWLDRLLAPAEEDRFQSAREALRALQAPDQPNPQLVVHPQPLGSRVRLQRDRRCLRLELPPSGLSAGLWPLLFFALFWNGFVLLWTLGALMGSVFFTLLSIPFWLVGIGLLTLVLMALGGWFQLEITPKTFQMGWSLLGFKRYVSGKTIHLEGIEVSTTGMQVNNRPVMTCTLLEGVRQHRFGSQLTQVEREWLCDEIKAYLQDLGDRIRSNP